MKNELLFLGILIFRNKVLTQSHSLGARGNNKKALLF